MFTVLLRNKKTNSALLIKTTKVEPYSHPEMGNGYCMVDQDGVIWFVVTDTDIMFELFQNDKCLVYAKWGKSPYVVE